MIPLTDPVLKRKSLGAFAGASLMGVAAGWSVVAVWLSAHQFIPVYTELASYWVSLLAGVAGGYMCFRSQSESAGSADSLWRGVCVACALVVVMTSWRLSDQRFIAWKMRAIPPDAAWPQMVSDLESVGRRVAESGRSSLPMKEPPPKSLQQLGSEVDYKGVSGNLITSPEYDGVTAAILFGYKGRCLGLCVGPEGFAKKYGRDGRYIRVATNAFFFAAPRG